MNSELQQEQKRVDSVMETIHEEINRLEEETTRRKNEVVHIRKHFWDEVKVNTDTFDDYLETIIGLRQEAQALSVNQSTHRHASKRLSTLRRMQEVPYFGRIDFIEEGNSTQEQIYIGISSLSDTSGENFLIYDWRAPVSSVYYDYQPGPAKYVTPGGPSKAFGEKVAISYPRRLLNPCSIRVSPLETRFYSRFWAKVPTNNAKYSSDHSTGSKPDHPS